MLFVLLLALIAINAGSAKLNPYQVILAVLGKGNDISDIVIWRIRITNLQETLFLIQ